MRPEDSIFQHFPRLNPLQKAGLSRLGLLTIADLLYTLPSRYGPKIQTKSIKDLVETEEASIVGEISNVKISKAFVKKIPIGEVEITDGTGSIKAVWYHQVYLAKKVPEGHTARISGTVTARKGVLYIANPEIEAVDTATIATAGSLFGDGEELFFPVYSETRGLSSSWIHHAIQKILRNKVHEEIADPIPAEILAKYNLPKLSTAFIWIHAPKDEKNAQAARKRFAFEEIFAIQLTRQRAREKYRENPSFAIPNGKEALGDFSTRLPFPLTGAQKSAVEAILSDMNGARPMGRLLEGDVGSGKTAVAAAAAYGVITASNKGQPLQIAYMAPTEILARQQFESFIQYFSHLGYPVGLITGSGARKFPSKISKEKHADVSRAQFLKWVASGEMPVVVGTHALIQKAVEFKNLALVIIDEQHRFGINQRAKLARKQKKTPHLLSMTATPIPRTLALTIYGDLDLSVLDEMPPGRKPVVTQIVPPNKRKETYEEIRKRIAEGRQLFVICPRIDEPDPTKEMALNAKSAVEEAKRLQKDVFSEFSVGCVHGKMKPDEKEGTMRDFAQGKLDILVATSVIEVGVNVPNATMIILEGAERFGLAQLHQLRGRVVRGSHQAYCYVFSDTKTQKTLDRLRALATAKNGFELAEIDLAQRGSGELSGRKQWGISDIGMEAIKNIKMVEAARTEAKLLIERDPELANHPLLRAKIAHEEIHFE